MQLSRKAFSQLSDHVETRVEAVDLLSKGRALAIPLRVIQDGQVMKMRVER